MSKKHIYIHTENCCQSRVGESNRLYWAASDRSDQRFCSVCLVIADPAHGWKRNMAATANAEKLGVPYSTATTMCGVVFSFLPPRGRSPFFVQGTSETSRFAGGRFVRAW